MTIANPVPRITIKDAPSQTLTMARDVPQNMLIMGCAERGPNTVTTQNNGSVAKALYGKGALSEVFEYKQELDPNRTATLALRLPSTTPGVLTLDTSGVSGDVVIEADPDEPTLAEHDLYVEVLKSGNVGASGIRLRWTLDAPEDRRSYTIVNLGTGATLVIPGVGALRFDVPEAELVALANDLATKTAAHFAYVTNSVHGGADTTSDDGYGSAATDRATAITRIAAVLAGLKLHVVKTSGSVHGAEDSLAKSVLNSIQTPTTSFRAVIVANLIDAVFDAHRLRTASIHGAVDAANIVTADPAVPASFEVGDVIIGRAIAPRWAPADLTAAFQKVTVAHRISMVSILEPIMPEEAPLVTSGLNRLESLGLQVTAHVQMRNRYRSVVMPAGPSITLSGNTITRATGSFLDDGFMPNMTLNVGGAAVSANNAAFHIKEVAALTITLRPEESLAPESASTAISLGGSETEDEWMTNLESEYSFEDDRIERMAGRHFLTHPREATRLARDMVYGEAIRLIVSPISVDPGQVLDQFPIGGRFMGRLDASLYADGQRVHHDEWDTPGLAAAGFTVLRSHQDGREPYVNRGLVAASSTGRIETVVQARIRAEARRICLTGGIDQILLRMTPDSTNPKRLGEAAAAQIDAYIRPPLQAALRPHISNADAEDLLFVDPDTNLETGIIQVQIKARTLFYPEGFEFTIDVPRPEQS